MLLCRREGVGACATRLKRSVRKLMTGHCTTRERLSEPKATATEINGALLLDWALIRE